MSVELLPQWKIRNGVEKKKKRRDISIVSHLEPSLIAARNLYKSASRNLVILLRGKGVGCASFVAPFFFLSLLLSLSYFLRVAFLKKKNFKVKKQNKKQGTLMCIPYNVVMIAPVNSIDCQSDL